VLVFSHITGNCPYQYKSKTTDSELLQAYISPHLVSEYLSFEFTSCVDDLPQAQSSANMAILMHTTKRKILIPEKVSPDGLALLKDQFDVDEKKGLSPEELKDIIGDYDALIVRSETKVTADLLSAAKKMKVVARAGVGVDNVDVQSATSHGIIVVNSPSGNINAAAEHTIACG
jgi:hypothetical protein